MPNKKCMYEGCDAPEHRKSGYCIRHTESGPRSILINTSKFVNEEPSDEVKVEFVGEEENEEEALPEIEEKAQEEELKVKKKRKTMKAIIAKAVNMFFLFIFLSGVIIKSYLSEKEQKPKINIRLNIQILIWLFLG